jgi:hypothetical protein
MNPWPGRKLKVFEVPGGSEIQAPRVGETDRYGFAAAAGREYRIEAVRSPGK